MKLLWILGTVLSIGMTFVLYCCILVGAEADRHIEECHRSSFEKWENTDLKE